MDDSPAGDPQRQGQAIRGRKDLAARSEGHIKQVSLSLSPGAAIVLSWTLPLLCSQAEPSENEAPPLFSDMIFSMSLLLLFTAYPGLPSVTAITLLRSCHLCYSMTPGETKVILLKTFHSDLGQL